MRHAPRRVGLAVVAVVCLAASAVLGGVLWLHQMAAQSQPPADPIVAAWERARATGSYRFDGDVNQVTLPSAIPANVGRSSRSDPFHLEGQANLRGKSLEMQLWPQGGSVTQTDTAVGIKVENGKTYRRQNTGENVGGYASEWKEDSSVSVDGIAPQGDFLAFLSAVRDVTAHAPETRAGLTFQRYTFQIDGPAFALMVRDQMEAGMRQKGELPPGTQLTVPDYYRQMTGEGELWVQVGGARDGLPLRQSLTLSFPEQRNESVQAQITINFLAYGQPDAPSGLMGLMASLRDQWPSLLNLALAGLALFAIVLLIRFHTGRRLQKALAVTLVVAIVMGPELSGIKTATFLDAQFARAATRAEQAQEADAAQALREIDKAAQFNPHQNPLEAAERRAVAETRLSAVALSRGVSAPQAQTLPTDNGTDTDADGMSDFAEARIGTSAVVSDTDNDGVADGVEVRGFQLGGKTWYLNAQSIDSNDDGIGDGAECWITPPALNTLASAMPGCDLDTDADGTPDVLDRDNDNDGVPDRLDQSPYVSTGATTFGENSPLRLTLNRLTPNVPVFVDFQLRPVDAKHLNFAFNVLDWPRDDKAQVEDIDGTTWADVASSEGRTAAANESFGDMKLIPMLEIRITGTPTNLPPQSTLTPYNITVNDYVAGGATQVAYVPLNLQTDEKTGMRVAFTGRMRYLPGGSWPSPHEVRLVWVVQGLVDVPCDPKAANAAQVGCASDGYIHNQPQVLQSYPDTWQLTGLNVSENHGAKTAIIYEDPAVDPNKKDDAALAGLASGLDNAFLGGRDLDTNGQRDITVDEIARRFDHATNGGISADQRWGLTNTVTTTLNILTVVRRDYPTLDQAVIFTAMTETLSLLSSQFNASWTADNTLKPTLMFALEQQSRALSLDGARAGNGYVAFNGNSLTLDMQPPSQTQAALTTMATLKWAHYCRADAAAAWAVCASDVYWNELDSRTASAPALPGDPADPDVAAGRAYITHNYDLALSQGVNKMVQQDATVLSGRYSMPTDSSLANNLRAAFLGAAPVITVLANTIIMARFVNQIPVVKQLGITVRRLIAGKAGQLLIPAGFGSNLAVTTAVAATAILAIALLATTIYFATQGNLAAKIVLKTVIIGLQVVLSVVDPILTVLAWQRALQAAGGTALKLSSSVEALGTSRLAGAVGAAIGIAVTWGFFIYSMVSNNVTAFSPEFNKALAETIAATIYLILIAIISATIVGAILVGIVAVIDAILTAVCELGVSDLRKVPGLGGACFTLGTTVVKGIAYFLYNYDLMIDTGRSDLVAPGSPQTTLANPNKGFSAGNPVSITMPITTNISHKSPAIANGIYINLYLYLFSRSNLRSSTFKYTLSQPDKQDIGGLSRDQMSGAWQNVREHHKYIRTPMYGGSASITPPAISFSNSVAGLNQTMPFYLNMGYALPAYECWAVPVLFFYPIPVCYTRTFKGNNSNKIDTLQYDVFPATLDSFMTLTGKPDSGTGLSWDASFPSLYDADGDGLIAGNRGGLDPNDATADTDLDGLSDAYELDRRANGLAFSPISCDTDSDTLTDWQETLIGTNPGIFDTDNDGLSDSQEVWHQVYVNCQPTNTWIGGWDVPINASTPFTIHVTSDPSQPDSDSDGISDLAEKQLVGDANPAKRVDKLNRPWHPGVFNTSPISIYGETLPRFVRPGQSFVYTASIASTAALAPSVLDVAVPPVLSGNLPPMSLAFDPLTFNDAQTVTRQMTLTVQAGLSTQQLVITNGVRARLASSGPVTYTWDAATGTTLSDLTGQPYAQYASMVPPPAGSQDSYMFSVMTSDAGNQNRGGTGDIRTYAIPSGQQRIIDNGSSPAATRGRTAPNSACNSAGRCLMAWDELRSSGSVVDVIKGALINADGSINKSVALTPTAASFQTPHYFAPVVASDGTNFLVAAEVATGDAKTYLVAQEYDSNGNYLKATFYLVNASRLMPSNDQALSLAIVWKGDRYRVLMEEDLNTQDSGDDNIYVADLTLLSSTGTGTLNPALIYNRAFVYDTQPPAIAYDPNTDRTLLLWADNGNATHLNILQGNTLPASPPALAYVGTGNFLAAVYNPMAQGWLININGSITLLNPDGTTFANTVGSPGGVGVNMACPAPESEPVLDWRFEEAPGATTFVDSSANANDATCAGNTCPISAIPGAVDSGGIAAGTPASDYAAYFDGVNDSLVVPSPINPNQDSFSVSFWYSSTRTQPSNFAIFIGNALISMYQGDIGYLVGNDTGSTTNAFGSVDDSTWHFITFTSDRIAGAYALYVDGVSTPLLAASTTNPYGNISNVSLGGLNNTRTSLDNFQLYRAPLSATAVQALYNRTRQSYCAWGSTGSTVRWGKLNVRASDPRGGKITTGGTISITVDADVPTSTIDGLINGQYIAGNKTHTIGGNASDPTSGIAQVEVNLNNTGFQPANGSATWAYNLTVAEGTYALQSRATDLAGNMEAPGPGITLIADATPPDVTLNAVPGAAQVPAQNANGQWAYAFSGTVSDPVIGALPGSGVAPQSVEVRLLGKAGEAEGNGWQTATLSSGMWSISYTLPAGLVDPTGVYTVNVRAVDNVGNRTSDAAAAGLLSLDVAGPTAGLSDADAARAVISTTLLLTGVVSDTGEAGLDQLEVSFTTAGQIATLPEEASPDEAEAQITRTWRVATLAQRGAGITQTTWSITVPTGLESMVQIDLRGRDLLSNTRVTSNIWRGVIDALPPRVSMTATVTGRSYFDASIQRRRYQVTYACAAVDQYLDPTTFQCPGNGLRPPTRILSTATDLQRLFPDLVLNTGMVNTYTLWQTSTVPAAQMRACDSVGHCASAGLPAIATTGNTRMQVQTELLLPIDLPAAMVIAPSEGSYVAADASSTISVTVAAETEQPLREISILLDGTVVATIPFAQTDGITQTQRTVALSPTGEGLHTLVASATDWAGTVQNDVVPITFILDTQPPTATLDLSTLTVSDTWQLESGVLRFRGTASDSVGLSAVQVKVDDLPFADAAFKDGAWQTALPLTDPEGKTLSVTVRAIDFAGQRTTLSHIIGTDLSSADEPDTSITSGPANPSGSTAATFIFTGTSVADEVVAFDCQLDEGAYAPCVSPLALTELSNGGHTLRVRAIDSNGYADLTPASQAWVIEVAALKTTVTAGPSGATTSRTASLSFTGAAGTSSFECALDTGVFTDCTSPQSYADLADGAHTFQVRARDGSGNTGAATRVVWTVLNAAPVASSQTVTTTENKALVIELVANDDETAAGTLLFELDPPAHGVLQGLPPNVSYTPNTGFVGTDQFTFRASDSASASDVATVTIVVRDYDITPPTSLITVTPTLPTGQQGWYTSWPQLTVGATDGMDPKATGVAETRCVLDPVTPPATFDAMAAGCAYLDAGAALTSDGAHILYVASRDAVNNQESPISKTVQVDRTPPMVQVLGVVGGGRYVVGAVPPAGCATTDMASGVAAAATVNVSGGDAQGMGVFLVTCSGAADVAGNHTGIVRATYTVGPFVTFYLPQVIADPSTR